jgi:orotidine-5'-phosphate decarboxylase
VKLHDIPATVSRAMTGIADLGVQFATVHCGETPKMLEAAVDGSKEKVSILGVTVLTSVSAENIKAAGFRSDFYSNLSGLVIQRAQMAKSAGCAGVVCSGLEAPVIKQHFGDEFVTVTPGIRPLWASGGQDDQRRITTPAQAVKNGSDYLVIGRPIRESADPREAVDRIVGEIASRSELSDFLPDIYCISLLEVHARQEPERNLAASESDRTPTILLGSPAWMKMRCTSLSNIC